MIGNINKKTYQKTLDSFELDHDLMKEIDDLYDGYEVTPSESFEEFNKEIIKESEDRFYRKLTVKIFHKAMYCFNQTTISKANNWRDWTNVYIDHNTRMKGPNDFTDIYVNPCLDGSANLMTSKLIKQGEKLGVGVSAAKVLKAVSLSKPSDGVKSGALAAAKVIKGINVSKKRRTVFSLFNMTSNNLEIRNKK